VSTASTSSRHSTIVRKYQGNDTRGLTGTRQHGLAALRLPKARPTPAKAKSPPKPQPVNRRKRIAAAGMEIVTMHDPAWARSFLMRGSEVVLCSGPFRANKDARKALHRLIDATLPPRAREG